MATGVGGGYPAEVRGGCRLTTGWMSARGYSAASGCACGLILDGSSANGLAEQFTDEFGADAPEAGRGR